MINLNMNTMLTQMQIPILASNQDRLHMIAGRFRWGGPAGVAAQKIN